MGADTLNSVLMFVLHESGENGFFDDSSEQLFLSSQMSSVNYSVDEAAFLAENLRQDRVKYYIECSPARQRAYNQVADAFDTTSKRCKFIIGITDGEMQSYIESKNHPGKRVKDKNLLGKWVLTSNYDYSLDTTRVKSLPGKDQYLKKLVKDWEEVNFYVHLYHTNTIIAL